MLQASYPTGTGPTAIATGDFDGDGRIDLTVVTATASTVSILRGTPGGAFVAGATVAVAAGAAALAVADLDQGRHARATSTATAAPISRR